MGSLNKIIFMLISCFILFGCSDGNDSGNATTQKDHVWKEKTDMINKAKAVEGMMLESAAATREAIDEGNK